MAIKNRKCIACQTSYSYCPDCSRADRLAPAWKSQFCSEDCMTLWMTLVNYNMSNITKDEAKEIVSSINLKPIDVYVACVQRDYAKVMAEEKKSRKIKKFEPVIEFEPIVEIEPVVEESVVTEVENPTEHEVVLKEKE